MAETIALTLAKEALEVKCSAGHRNTGEHRRQAFSDAN